MMFFNLPSELFLGKIYVLSGSIIYKLQTAFNSGNFQFMVSYNHT